MRFSKIKNAFKKKDKSLKYVSKLDVSTLNDVYEKEKNYQANRINLLVEKKEKTQENRMDEIFNLAVEFNASVEKLNLRLDKFKEKQKNHYVKLHNRYLNLEIDAKTYNSEKANLDQIISARVSEYEKKIDHKKDSLEKRRVKITNSMTNRIKKINKLGDDYVEKVRLDGEKKLNKLKEQITVVDRQNPGFYKTKKSKVSDSLNLLNAETETVLKNSKTEFDGRKLALNNYKNVVKTTTKKYVSTVNKLAKEAKEHAKGILFVNAKTKVNRFTEVDRYSSAGKSFLSGANASKLLLIFILFAIVTGINFPRFFTPNNFFQSIFASNIYIGFIALGETFVILTGGIDLSVGSMIGFGGVGYMYTTVVLGQSWVVGIIVTILFTVAIGFINGILISKLKIPPFITTLASLLALRGAIYLILNGVPLSNANDPLFEFLNQKSGGIPNIVFIFFAMAAVAILLVKFLRAGRYIYATGDNLNAARLSGINTNAVLVGVYTMSGLFAAFAAIAAASSINSVSPTAGNANELDAITAVVLGGTSTLGGKGGLWKTVVGWFVVSLLINTFTFYNLDSNTQYVIKGIIILVAVALDRKYYISNRYKKYKRKVLSFVL